MQKCLQSFAWTEEELGCKKQERMRDIPEVCEEPMFCFETAIKLHAFSVMAYKYKKVSAYDSGWSVLDVIFSSKVRCSFLACGLQRCLY